MKKRGTHTLTLVFDNKFCPKSKRSQVTIFIIIGIILVSAIALFFLLRSGVVVPGIGGKAEKNPNIFLESCIEDKVKEGIEIISLQGGYIDNPLHKTYLFEGEDSPTNVSYLCYAQIDGVQCVNQEPMLIQHLKDEMHDYISDDVGDCFDDLASSLERQNYVVSVKYEEGNFEVKLMERKVVIEIDAELTLTKADETSKQEDFKIIIPSRFYDLAIVVLEIVNKEASACDFSNYDMFLYSEFDINKYPTSDSSIIYTVKHEDSEEGFRFAVRGCVISSGFGLEFE